VSTLKKGSLAIGAHATSLAVMAMYYFNVSFTTNEKEKAQSASSPLKVAGHMLEQNGTSERMLILSDVIIEAKENSKAFLQTIHALQTSTQRVNRSTGIFPRAHLIPFFCKKHHISEQRKFVSTWMLSLCILAEYH
jgi:hypothetical protein